MVDLIKQPVVKQAIQLYVQEPTLTAKEIGDKLGVSAALVYSWKQNPKFVDAIYTQFMSEFGIEIPAVMQAMLREAKAGNVQAARLLLEWSGKLVKNINITIDSPYEKFLKAEKSEIEYEDAEITEIVDSIPEIKNLKEDLPKRKVEDQIERVTKEKRQIKKAIDKEQHNKQRREWHKWNIRAMAVGVDRLPSGRPTPAQKETWKNEIKAKENK